MPSPFPGMNPWLEQDEVWDDFHNSFMVRVRDMLIEVLSPRYYTKVGQRLYIHELSAQERRFIGRADVGVRDLDPQAKGTAAKTLEAPATIALPTIAVDYEKSLSVDIRAHHGDEVVTTVEMLSPSNKRGRDRDQYLAKRDQMLRSNASFVEIDLLRGGQRMPFDEPLPQCCYYAMVSVPDDRPRAAIWTVHMRERLPVIPIPLQSPDAPVHIDLQEVLHRVYDAGGYGRLIYRGKPQPALRADDAAWAEAFMPRKQA